MKIVELLLPVLVPGDHTTILSEAAKFEGVDEAHIGHEGTVAGRRRELPRALAIHAGRRRVNYG